jgi:hypothetical protein
MVEGARIDHAGHANDADALPLEVVALDEAVAATLRFLEPYDGWTVIVTADHECGGYEVIAGGAAGTAPEAVFRPDWRDHTNVDVPVFAVGPGSELLDDEPRVDNRWIHAALVAAIDGAPPVAPGPEPRLPDGRTADLGPAVAAQDWETSFGVGYNQLDALHVTADADGLWVGIDGVFELDRNTPVVLVDLDPGAGTGVGGAVRLVDGTGELDVLLATLDLDVSVAGVAFDAAVGSVGSREVQKGDLRDDRGLRGFMPPWGRPDDLAWLVNVGNVDEGNHAMSGAPAVDAGVSPGGTVDGWEVMVPWDSLYPAGLPADGVELAVVALLVDDYGSWTSNQLLPSLLVDAAPEAGPIPIDRVVTLSVDVTGAVVSGPAVSP